MADRRSRAFSCALRITRAMTALRGHASKRSRTKTGLTTRTVHRALRVLEAEKIAPVVGRLGRTGPKKRRVMLKRLYALKHRDLTLPDVTPTESAPESRGSDMVSPVGVTWCHPEAPQEASSPLTPLPEVEAVGAPSRPAPPEGADRAGADGGAEKKPTERPPFQTSIIHAVPDVPHDPGPQPSPVHRLHQCLACNERGWHTATKAGHWDCPACGKWEGRTLHEPPEQEAARQEASDARAAA